MKLRKRRKFVNHRKRIMYFSLFFVLLFISVGYAYLSATLSITGHTEISANTWDIHFENLTVTQGSVNATTPAAIQSNTTSINYSVELGMPGDFYEFEVDIVNSGTLPGKVSIVNIQGIASGLEQYIETSVEYSYGIPVSVDDILNSNSRKRIIVRVAYTDDLNNLPGSNISLDLVFSIDFNQTNQNVNSAAGFLQNLLTEGNTCIVKYEGQVTDSVGITKTATNVYYDRCLDKRNVIFGGFCWQIIRSTETGGLKMIYNGEPVNGECNSSRADHKGIVQVDRTDDDLGAQYMYGSSYTYDTTTGEFTLLDTTTGTFSESNYDDYVGKYTCKNLTGTCDTIYYVLIHFYNAYAYVISYEIADTNYAGIGKSAYNGNTIFPGEVGYMLNKYYDRLSGSPTSESLMGNDVSYSNGVYTLLPASGESVLGTTKDNNHHYTCDNTTGTCSTVRFYYYEDNYIELNGEANIEDTVDGMLKVNRYNSVAKSIIDIWYMENLANETDKLEDTVFCNARDIINQATTGWNKNGDLSTYMYFRNSVDNGDITCPNVTDQFAVGNNLAKLTYPVALTMHEDLYNLVDGLPFGEGEQYVATNDWWMTMSPRHYDLYYPYILSVYNEGQMSSYGTVATELSIRPVVSLSHQTRIVSGTGSEADPWIVE